MFGNEIVIVVDDVPNLLHWLRDRMLVLLRQHLLALQFTKHLPRVRISEMLLPKVNVLAMLLIWYALCYFSFFDDSSS